jgi:hypothetical protein
VTSTANTAGANVFVNAASFTGNALQGRVPAAVGSSANLLTLTEGSNLLYQVLKACCSENSHSRRGLGMRSYCILRRDYHSQTRSDGSTVVGNGLSTTKAVVADGFRAPGGTVDTGNFVVKTGSMSITQGSPSLAALHIDQSSSAVSGNIIDAQVQAGSFAANAMIFTQGGSTVLMKVRRHNTVDSPLGVCLLMGYDSDTLSKSPTVSCTSATAWPRLVEQQSAVV